MQAHSSIMWRLLITLAAIASFVNFKSVDSIDAFSREYDYGDYADYEYVADPKASECEADLQKLKKLQKNRELVITFEI